MNAITRFLGRLGFGAKQTVATMRSERAIPREGPITFADISEFPDPGLVATRRCRHFARLPSGRRPGPLYRQAGKVGDGVSGDLSRWLALTHAI